MRHSFFSLWYQCLLLQFCTCCSTSQHLYTRASKFCVHHNIQLTTHASPPVVTLFSLECINTSKTRIIDTRHWRDPCSIFSNQQLVYPLRCRSWVIVSRRIANFWDWRCTFYHITVQIMRDLFTLYTHCASNYGWSSVERRSAGALLSVPHAVKKK